jgi:hypothetical protein
VVAPRRSSAVSNPAPGADPAVMTEGRLVALEKDVSFLVDASKRLTDGMDKLVEAALPRRVDDLETEQKTDRLRVDAVCKDQEALRSEIRGGLKVLSWGVAILVVLGVIVALMNGGYVLLQHLAGGFRP